MTIEPPPPETGIHRRGPTMAWRSGGATNADLIGNLFRNGLITSQRVRDAMLRVDRAHYCPNPSYAYADSPQPIGHRATISAPHMHAHAAESLLPYLPISSSSSSSSSSPPRPLRVLDIGSGSGYLTHVLAELVPANSRVVGVEHISELRDLGERNMRRSDRGRQMLEDGKVRFVVGDGRRGWIDPDLDVDAEAGWDVIHVGAAASRIHEELISQLRRPGRMFIPVEEGIGGDQYIYVVDKDGDGNVTTKKLYGVSYVPLTDAPPRR